METSSEGSSGNPESKPTSLKDAAYPPCLRKAEDQIRRAGPHRDQAPTVGFGLSGGGIRSATFCLGVFQALADLGLLKNIDYISSVSGGGYFAGFYGRLLSRPDVTLDEVSQILSPDGQKRADFAGTGAWKAGIFEWLRENGRYLAPRGGGDLLLGIAVALRNWLTVLLILATFLLGLFLIAQVGRLGMHCLRGELTPYLNVPIDSSSAAASAWWWSPYAMIAGLMSLLWVFPTGWAYWMFQSSSSDPATSGSGRNRRASGDASPSSLVWALLSLFPVIVVAVWLMVGFTGKGLIAGTGLLAFCVSALFFRAVTLRKAHTHMSRRAGSANASYKVSLFEEARDRSSLARNLVSKCLRNALIATLAMLAFGLIDSAGQTLYALSSSGNLHTYRWLAALVGSLAGVAPFAQWVFSLITGNGKTKRFSMPVGILLGIAAAVVIVPFLISLDSLSHAIAYDFEIPAEAPDYLVTPADTINWSVSMQINDAKLKNADVQASREEGAPPEGYPRNPISLVFVLLVTVVFSWLVGSEPTPKKAAKGPPDSQRSSLAWRFLNRSSLHELYTARLIRAYLGASNKFRLEPKGEQAPSVDEVMPGDDIAQERYFRAPVEGEARDDASIVAKGGPIHLVNVTLNETLDGESQVEQRDRKGLGMAIGPAGISVGVRHHMVFKPSSEGDTHPEVEVSPATGEFRVFDYPDGKFSGEKLSLGNWVGVSGAAVSTGMGSRTSLGLSLLTGFFNARLGYWWDSGATRLMHLKKRRVTGAWLHSFVAIQDYLLDNLLARFHGTARRRWYLTDGGHFENLGGYELIRRRLPLIVLVDGGADADYTFEDVAALVRKARLDFNTEIEFLDTDGLTGCLHKDLLGCFGTLEQLRRGRWGEEPVAGAKPIVALKSPNETRLSRRAAALARVRYLDEPNKQAFLILIKPALMGDEPEDVLQYHSAHPAFPHETTANQFFDEAQWESYRRLGQHIAEKVFARLSQTDDGPSFIPNSMSLPNETPPTQLG